MAPRAVATLARASANPVSSAMSSLLPVKSVLLMRKSGAPVAEARQPVRVQAAAERGGGEQRQHRAHAQQRAAEQAGARGGQHRRGHLPRAKPAERRAGGMP